MVSRSGSREKSGGNRSGDTGDKDRLIAELKDRVAVLEKELRSKHDPASQDITERKREEEAVRAADVRFRSLIQNSSDIIRILDKEGHIIYESPSSDKILGYPPDYTLGRSPLEFIHPDDRERVRKDLDEALDGRNPGTPTEFRIRKADGSYLEVESIGKNMIGVPGVGGIVITTRPITERKRAEEALRKSEARPIRTVCASCLHRKFSLCIKKQTICTLGSPKSRWLTISPK